MLPIPDVPAAMSFPSSIRSALVHATMIDTPAELCVNVPGPRGKIVLESVEFDAGSGSADGSV